MLNRVTALAAFLALCIVLAACGGSAEDENVDKAAEKPAPTPTATVTPQAEATATAIPTAVPTPVEKSTGDDGPETPSPEQTATEVSESESESTEEPTGEDAADEPIDVAAHLSEKTMRLWDVYNEHDPDALAVFYSEDYWQEEVDEIRANMQPFKNLGLTFTAEETSPPTEIEPGKWELKHTARFQGGLVNMVFIYEEFDGDWRLTYAKPE